MLISRRRLDHDDGSNLMKLVYVLEGFGVVGVHHVGILCENLERSLHFYQNILGKSFFLLQGW